MRRSHDWYRFVGGWRSKQEWRQILAINLLVISLYAAVVAVQPHATRESL